MKQAFVSFACGFLFALGLGISGMTQPGVVTAFLDFFGEWDPRLAFVMVGAIGVYSIGFRCVVKKSHPVFSETFQIPKRKKVDRPLVVGAILFGAGWGLGGFCPGPALTSMISFGREPLVFGVSMLFGMAIFQRMKRKGTQA